MYTLARGRASVYAHVVINDPEIQIAEETAHTASIRAWAIELGKHSVILKDLSGEKRAKLRALASPRESPESPPNQ